MTNDIRSLYVTALQNTHAIELQALQIMERQVDRLQEYEDDDEESAFRKLINETHGQGDRLKETLDDLAESPSTIKEGFMGVVGSQMALGHTPTPDEILKNAFANQAFENFEMAAYNSLIVTADEAGQSAHIGAFKKSLEEQVAMANAVAQLVKPTTKQYLDLTRSGQKADR